jgi:6-phosphogluconolactonase
MQPRWHPTESDSAWLAAALAFVAHAEREALAARGEFHIVLAGGGTPRILYVALARETHEWARWQVWFGDERCLSPDHPDRNSAMARAALLDRVASAGNAISGNPPQPPFSKGGRVLVHAIPAELGASAAARAYAQELAGVGDFDLVLLGLGEDGHTASLFPGCGAAPEEADALAVFDAPKPPPERVSLSARRLSRARQVLFLVSGAGKRDALARWRAGEPIPAAAIQPEAGVDVLLAPDLSTPGVFS